MPTPPVTVRDTKRFLRGIRREVLAELRAEANRVRRTIRSRAPRRSGNLRRKIKTRTGWDNQGPWARVTTTARNPKTRFRYGLAIQQREHYMQDGFRATPRR